MVLFLPMYAPIAPPIRAPVRLRTRMWGRRGLTARRSQRLPTEAGSGDVLT